MWHIHRFLDIFLAAPSTIYWWQWQWQWRWQWCWSMKLIMKSIYSLAACGVDSHETNNSDSVGPGRSQKSIIDPDVYLPSQFVVSLCPPALIWFILTTTALSDQIKRGFFFFSEKYSLWHRLWKKIVNYVKQSCEGFQQKNVSLSLTPFRETHWATFTILTCWQNLAQCLSPNADHQ